ncbi:hypothetical protein [Psychroserpens mesophilus]|uniref:hypothetical protein n=1 Tax=Psychroserpens mesophilus TaxID=325473 RepID=UPI00058D12C3|nr:hypothetical protein [Psychroserpens mesophilus]
MSVRDKITHTINHRDFLSYLIVLVLSTLLIGYAPSSISLGIFVFFAFRHAIINKVKFRFEIMILLPITLYILCCVSYFWSVDQQITLKGIGRLVALVVVPLAFSCIPKFSIRSVRLIFNWFSISNVLLGVFFIIVALLKYLKTGQLSVFTYHNLVEILDLNAIYVSVFYSLSFLFLLTKKKKKQRDFLSLAFLGILIFLLSSKMIIISFILCNLIYILFYKGIQTLKSPKTIALIVLSIGIATIASKQVIERFLVESTTSFEEVFNKEKFNKVYPWTGTSIRILQLRNLKGQLEEDDIFWKGFGLFASRENLRERHIAFNTYYGYHGYNYHNMYAQILSELGIFGLSILLLILVLGMIKAINTKYFIYFAFYLLMTMTFLTESFLWVQRGLFLFIIVHCMFSRTEFTVLNKPNTIN